VAPPRSLLVGRRPGPGRSESAFLPQVIRPHGAEARAWLDDLQQVPPSRRPVGRRFQVQRKALPRSLLAVPELACARADKFPGPSSPSRESASSISSRGAKPAMALLRFSTPSAWVRSGPPCRVRSEADRRPPIPCARKRGSSSSTWRSGYPRSPHRASPFRVFPPLRSVPVARSMPSWGCPRRVHRGSGAPSRPCSLCGVPCEPWQVRWVLSWGSPL
jgi:hypothetical protein